MIDQFEHFNPIDSFKIIQSDLCVIRGPQFRFPRSRKKRIRNKWAKQDKNYRWEPTGYRMGDSFVVHPAWMHRLRQQITDQLSAHIASSAASAAPWPTAGMPEVLTLERLTAMTQECRAIMRKYELADLMQHTAVKIDQFPYTPS